MELFKKFFHSVVGFDGSAADSIAACGRGADFDVSLTKPFQFTKICKSPRLTVIFSGIKICESSSMPIRPYP
jgi:hypothetical protein